MRKYINICDCCKKEFHKPDHTFATRFFGGRHSAKNKDVDREEFYYDLCKHCFSKIKDLIHQTVMEGDEQEK